jgi:hypothetical protein
VPERSIKYSRHTSIERCREFQLAGILKKTVEERTEAWIPHFSVGYNIYKSLAKSSGEKASPTSF